MLSVLPGGVQGCLSCQVGHRVGSDQLKLSVLPGGVQGCLPCQVGYRVVCLVGWDTGSGQIS